VSPDAESQIVKVTSSPYINFQTVPYRVTKCLKYTLKKKNKIKKEEAVLVPQILFQ